MSGLSLTTCRVRYTYILHKRNTKLTSVHLIKQGNTLKNSIKTCTLVIRFRLLFTFISKVHYRALGLSDLNFLIQQTLKGGATNENWENYLSAELVCTFLSK